MSEPKSEATLVCKEGTIAVLGTFDRDYPHPPAVGTTSDYHVFLAFVVQFHKKITPRTLEKYWASGSTRIVEQLSDHLLVVQDTTPVKGLPVYRASESPAVPSGTAWYCGADDMETQEAVMDAAMKIYFISPKDLVHLVVGMLPWEVVFVPLLDPGSCA